MIIKSKSGIVFWFFFVVSTRFCREWAKTMLSEAVDNPVFLRQVIENYKLRVIFANLSACSILLLCAIDLEKKGHFFPNQSNSIPLTIATRQLALPHVIFHFQLWHLIGSLRYSLLLIGCLDFSASMTRPKPPSLFFCRYNRTVYQFASCSWLNAWNGRFYYVHLSQLKDRRQRQML